jgi:hypothetical protein
MSTHSNRSLAADIIKPDLGHLSSFDGVVVEGDEGTHIAEAAGKIKGAILQNNSMLTCAEIGRSGSLLVPLA